MLDFDTCRFVFRAEHGFRESFEKFRQPGEKTEAGTEFGEAFVRHIVHAEVVEQALHVGEFAIPLLFVHERVAPRPELGGIDSEFRENHIVLHVAWAEGLIVVVNQSDGVLWSGHESVKGGKQWHWLATREKSEMPKREWAFPCLWSEAGRPS